MSNSQQILKVTAIQDKNSGIITAFFNQYPGLVVQTNDSSILLDKLKSVLKSYVMYLDAKTDTIQVNQFSL